MGQQMKQEQQIQQTVQHTISTVQSSMSKAITSLGGHYHNILNNVEKHYKDAVQKNSLIENENLNDAGSMTFCEMETCIGDSVSTLKTFIRRVRENQDQQNFPHDAS